MDIFENDRQELLDSWRSYLKSIELFINKVESEINEATRAGICTGKMCENAENLINELERFLQTFGQYPWRNEDDDSYIVKLRQLLSDLYSTVYTASRIS